LNDEGVKSRVPLLRDEDVLICLKYCVENHTKNQEGKKLTDKFRKSCYTKIRSSLTGNPIRRVTWGL